MIEIVLILSQMWNGVELHVIVVEFTTIPAVIRMQSE